MSFPSAEFGDKSRLRALLHHFSVIEHPRETWRVVHPLPGVLLLLVCARWPTATISTAIADWGEAHLAFLRRYLP